MKRSHLLFSLLVLGIAEANAQSAPGAASWPTWAIPDVGAFAVPPPPSATATRAEAEDLKIFANLRGEAVTESVRFWDAGAPPYRWIQIAQQEVANHNLGGPAATRAM